MFRDRPLTWLFIAATIVVDFVLMTIQSDQDFLASVKIGLLLGQLAALAIWSVRGQQHRLARASCLVVVTGLLTYVLDTKLAVRSTWLAFSSGYVLWIISVTLTSDVIRCRLREKHENEKPSNRWQVSLVELFGWTTVFAIICFGARLMNFGFLQWDSMEFWESIGFISRLLVVPTCMTLFTHRDLSDLRIAKILVLAIVIITSVCVTKSEYIGEYAVIFQIVYLVLWMPVLSMDGAQKKHVACLQGSMPQQSARAENPQLFNPQD